MGDFAADLWTFITILADNWFGRVGFVLGAIDIADRVFGGRSALVRWIRKVRFGWLAIACLLFASFQAWQDEHVRVVAAGGGQRRLTDSQRASLIHSLDEPPPGFTVGIRSTGNRDPESFRYALDFVEVFRARGWLVEEDHTAFVIRLPGLTLSTKTGDNATALRIYNALAGAGIEISEATEDDSLAAERVNLYFGEKPSAPFVR